MIRNLLYHVAALPNNELWLRNLEQLAARIELFNGYKAVAVADGPELLPWESTVRKVQELLGNCHVLKIRNDRNLREVASFRALLNEVKTTNPQHITFYAHTKGNSTYDDIRGAIYWRNMMYSKLLDTANFERVEKYLRTGAPAVGCNKMVWGIGKRSPFPSMLAHGTWMFAGTFFWFRNDKVFSNPKWTSIPQDRYGAEAWLSGLFKHEQCMSMFQPVPPEKFYGCGAPSPYDPDLYIRNAIAIEDIELQYPSYVI